MKQYRVAAVIFPGFEMLDLYGPLEMYSMHPDAFEIVAVAETMDPVPASGGPATMPKATFADGDDYDILLVPGGAGARRPGGARARRAGGARARRPCDAGARGAGPELPLAVEEGGGSVGI